MGATTVQVEMISTAGMSAQDSRELWNELVTSYQCRINCEFPKSQRFHGNVVRARTSLHQLVTWRADHVLYRRTQRHIRSDPTETYRLVLPLSGTVTVHQQDRNAQLGPNTACLVSMGQPFMITHSSHARPIMLTILREQVEHRLNGRAVTAAPVDLTTGLGGIVHNLVDDLLQQYRHLTPAQFNAVTDRTIELLCMVLSGDPSSPGSGRLADIEATVRRFVRLHAEESDLTGASIGAALGWSLRQIQLALQAAGTTPRELIREERLTLARDRLTSPAYRDMPITELAYRTGFGSAKAFSTAFRERFGVTPRELRRAHCAGADTNDARWPATRP